MSQQERYECNGCGTLNQLDQVNCKGCGLDLIEAKRVWCSDEAAARTDRLVDAYPCACPLPGGHTGEMCWACGGRIGERHLEQAPSAQDVQGEPSARAGSSRACQDAPGGQSSERAAQHRASFSLFLPDGRVLQYESMVLLGRNIAPLVGLVTQGLDGVSRKHVWIGMRCNELIALDLGSRNGTWLNGMQLRPWEAQYVAATAEKMRLHLGRYLEIDMQWSYL